MTNNSNNHNGNNIPLVACAILAALTTGGPTYAFGLYGATLKAVLQLTQSQLDTLSSANFCAGLFTWIPGLLVDRYGVQRCLIGGGIVGAAFMVLYWALATQRLLSLDNASTNTSTSTSSTQEILAALSLCGIGISLANGMVIGAIYKLLVCSCATSTKGSAVGVAKGYVGLGSGVYACIFPAVKTLLNRYFYCTSTTGTSSSDLDFLLMAAILAIVACVLPAWLLLPSQQEILHFWDKDQSTNDRLSRRHFMALYGGLLALAVMVVQTSLADLFSPLRQPTAGHTTNHITKGCMLLVLWIGPILSILCIPSTQTTESYQESYQENVECHQPSCSNNKRSGGGERLKLLPGKDAQPESFYSQQTAPTYLSMASSLTTTTFNFNDDSSTSSSAAFDTEEEDYDFTSSMTESYLNSMPGPKKDYTLLELVQLWHAWLLLWIGIVLVGSGTMMTNNMAQMIESLSLWPLESVTTASMAIFSVAQATSRIVTGALSDYALVQWKIPRPAFLIVASLVGIISHSILAMAQPEEPTLFILGVGLAGAAFGMIWPLMVLLVGEIFGTANMATNYLFYDGIASAMGTLLLSKFVTQQVYEAHIMSLDDNGDELGSMTTTTCIGTGCFETSHWIVVLLAFSCGIAGIQVVRRTQHVYVAASGR